MSSNTTKSFPLTLDPTYQEQDWGLSEAVREIIANALDAQTRGEGAMVLKHRGTKLTVSSPGVTLDRSVLLMGTSGSRGRDECIGTFGEGLPMAILTLSRLSRDYEDFSFQIDNGDERWRAEIAYNEEWGSDLCTVRTRKRRQAVPDAFTVTIDGVSKEDFNKLRDRFLTLDPTFDEAEAVKPMMWEYDRILLQPEMKGRVYVRGVFVKHRADLSYGYDLDLQLNRDRHMIDEWDLKSKLQNMLRYALENHPERFQAAVCDLVNRPDAEVEIGDAYWLHTSSKAVVAVTERFEETHGEGAIPCSNTEETRQLEAIGLKGAIVSKAVRRIVEVSRGTLEDAVQSRSMEALQIFSWSDLTETERGTLERADYVVSTSVVAGSGLLSRIKVVSFADERMKGRHCVKDGETEIMLSRSILGDFRETLITLIHEIAHEHPMAGDGTQLHQDLQLEIFADVVCSFAL